MEARPAELREYLDESGRSLFASWFSHLSEVAASKVSFALLRLRNGNFSNVEPVGKGVSELKIHFGPGLRVYFGKDGDRVVILLGGSTKQRQSEAIRRAQLAWQEYRHESRSTEGPQ